MAPELLECLNSMLNSEEHIRLMELHEMAQSHAAGLQGLKRFHRFNACDRARHSQMLRNYIVDHYHIEPSIVVSYQVPVIKMSVVESMKHMYDICEAHIEKIKVAINTAIQLNCLDIAGYLGMMLEDQSYEKETYNRYILKLSMPNVDIACIDSWLHTKYKCKEKEYFGYDDKNYKR